ncbi:MAG: TolC family protein [Candidatus Krumholzibacteriota bacterium]|nr:TolC family protein [Candidatus Krumholzibacteriota bacterium]
MKVRAATAAVVAASLFVVLPARADFYDLERAVGEAMDVSTNVGISREQLAFARSDVLRSYSNWLPNLFVRASTGHSFTGPTTSGFVDSQGRIVQGPATDFENYGFSINSSMTIFNWGASINRVNEAKRSADAAR